jgi:hypothetical protein
MATTAACIQLLENAFGFNAIILLSAVLKSFQHKLFKITKTI